MRSVSMWLNLYGCQAVRHKLKKGAKSLKITFSPFLSLRRTAWRAYKLRKIHALFINLSYIPKNQSLNFFAKKYWRLAELENDIAVFISFLHPKKRHQNPLLIIKRSWILTNKGSSCIYKPLVILACVGYYIDF